MPSVMKTEVPLDCDDLARKDLLLQQYGERIEKLSQQDKLSKFCMDAGFLNVVEIGQYFMTKDTADFSQFSAAACREYTLPRDEEASEPKGWIQGNTKIGHVLEVATCCSRGKYGVEIRIVSMNKDNSHSWVRISHGSNKFVTNLNNNEQEISEVQFKEYALKLDASNFACRSKAKAKPQRREPAGSSPRIVPIGKRTWTDIESGKYSFSDYEVSKKVMYLLRHSQSVHREEDGAVHFWRIKENLQNQFPHSPHWSDSKWKVCLAGGGGNKKRYHTVLIRQEQFYTSERFKVIQDAISLILLYRTMYLFRTFSSSTHITSMCNQFPFHHQFGIDTRRSKFEQQTDSILFACGSHGKEHKDPDTIDLEAPRLAQYMQTAWKKHQNTVYWVDINLALRNGLKF